jgi:hypothetical protein
MRHSRMKRRLLASLSTARIYTSGFAAALFIAGHRAQRAAECCRGILSAFENCCT